MLFRSASYSLDILKIKWKVLSTITDIQKIVDEDPISWFIQEKSKTPTAVTIDLGELLNLKGFIYLPSQDRWAEGTISHYIFEVSTDNIHWKKVSEGEFGNIKNNPIEQRITFITSFFTLPARYSLIEIGRASCRERV